MYSCIITQGQENTVSYNRLYLCKTLEQHAANQSPEMLYVVQCDGSTGLPIALNELNFKSFKKQRQFGSNIQLNFQRLSINEKYSL
jgi:hypothetical protein